MRKNFDLFLTALVVVLILVSWALTDIWKSEVVASTPVILPGRLELIATEGQYLKVYKLTDRNAVRYIVTTGVYGGNCVSISQ